MYIKIMDIAPNSKPRAKYIEQSPLLLRIFNAVYSSQKMAKKFSVAYLTYLNWCREDKIPSTHVNKVIEVCEDLSDEFEGLITFHFPEMLRLIKHKRLGRTGVMDEIERIIAKELKKPKAGFLVIQKAEKLGYKKNTILITAKKMGVKSTHIGIGRESYSLWELP